MDLFPIFRIKYVYGATHFKMGDVNLMVREADREDLALTKNRCYQNKNEGVNNFVYMVT